MAKTKPQQTQADLSEFFKYAAPKRPPCRVGFAASQLKPAERAQLEAACQQDIGIINAGAIQKWLQNRGHAVTPSAITNHRRGTCSCARKDI